jgi:hypothetical protein
MIGPHTSNHESEEFRLRVHYLGCFRPMDRAEARLLKSFGALRALGCDVLTSSVESAGQLRVHILNQNFSDCNVFVLGGHGHPSLSGFFVHDEEVRWHDLAHTLKGRLPQSSTFIFYSCYGAFPGIGHAFSKDAGPKFIFGPNTSVKSSVMTRAVTRLIESRLGGEMNVTEVCRQVDALNTSAKFSFFKSHNQSFIRVLWKEGRQIRRYPNIPSADRPRGPIIPSRGWSN